MEKLYENFIKGKMEITKTRNYDLQSKFNSYVTLSLDYLASAKK